MKSVSSSVFPLANSNLGLSATGVIHTDSKGRTQVAFIRDKREAILSVGAVGSPQLHLLGGVDPVPNLSSLHIPVVHSNPDVGNFIADNPRNTISIVIPFALDPSVAQVVGITGDFNIAEAISFNLSFSFPLSFGLFPNSTSPLEFSVANIAVKFSGPKSSGSLRLLSSAEEWSKNHNTEGFKFSGPPLPKNQSDDASMETFYRSTVRPFWHFYGGCLVGKAVDGEHSLRMVDGSTFNASPGTNPQATLVMMGRHIGLKILQ
nr:(R)-mandelonitrile lyase 2-like [Ziziphus jujuba var. spinosa]